MIESWDLFLDLLPGYAAKLGIALLCGTILGIERERKDKPAGLRTIVLITVGSTLFMIVSNLIPHIPQGPEAIVRIDPGRIAAQVVSGIGFLGAGTIIQARGSVHGLTTAAVIWVAAGIGLCIGIGFPLLALVFTLGVVAALVLMDPVRAWFERHGTHRSLRFIAPNDTLVLRQVELALTQQGTQKDKITTRPLSEDEVLVETGYHASASTTARLLHRLSRIDGVRGVRRFEEEAP